MVDTKAILKKAELFEKLALYGDRKSFLQALAQSQDEYGYELNPMEPGFAGELPSSRIVGNKPLSYPEQESKEKHSTKVYKSIAHGSPINPQLQKALILLYPNAMSGSRPDGVFGPRTQSAMNQWKTERRDNRGLADPSLQKDIITSAGLAQIK
jgi:peptidoglycan hydrolase-like protein with peptidoglycan-binding domain